MFFNYLHIPEISCKSCLFITVQFVVQQVLASGEKLNLRLCIVWNYFSCRKFIWISGGLCLKGGIFQNDYLIEESNFM